MSSSLGNHELYSPAFVAQKLISTGTVQRMVLKSDNRKRKAELWFIWQRTSWWLSTHEWKNLILHLKARGHSPSTPITRKRSLRLRFRLAYESVFIFFMGMRAGMTSNGKPEILIEPIRQRVNENFPFYSPEMLSLNSFKWYLTERTEYSLLLSEDNTRI